MSCPKWPLGDLSNGEPHLTPVKAPQEYGLPIKPVGKKNGWKFLAALLSSSSSITADRNLECFLLFSGLASRSEFSWEQKLTFPGSSDKQPIYKKELWSTFDEPALGKQSQWLI